MFALSLYLATQFSMVTSVDPVSNRMIARYTMSNDEVDLFGIACVPGKDKIEILIIPAGFRGGRNGLGMTGVSSRFQNDLKVEKNAWQMSAHEIRYVGDQANFISRLALSNKLHFNYEGLDGRLHSHSIEYSIDNEKMQRFLALCNPVRVNRELRRLGVKAAPVAFPGEK